VSDHAVAIEYSRQVLDEIRAETVDGLLRIRQGGMEVGGVLFGLRREDRIQILNWRQLPCEYALGPSFVLSERDADALDTLIANAKADLHLGGLHLGGLEPVGWYHSHTRTGVFLSDSDMAVYDRHFPAPWQVALVLQPSQLGSAEAGFFFRESDGSVRRESSYSPFTLYPLANSRHPNPSREEAVSSNTLPEPFRRVSETPPAQKWPWLITAAVLALLAIGVLTGVVRISGFPPSRPDLNLRDLNLRAADRDGHVRIEWNRVADPIVSAEKASILIVDGDRTLETTLGQELLRTGSLVYQRKSSDVEIRMRIDGGGSGPVQALTRLIGLPGPLAVPIEPQKGGPKVEKVATPARISAASSRAALAERGARGGRLIWSGTLAAGKTLRIDGDHASAGHLTGSMPKAPIRVSVYPASFARWGINVFARDLSGAKEIHEAPGTGNGRTLIVYKRDPKRAGDVVVTESPSARNNWQKLALKARSRTVSVIVVDWQLVRRNPQP
jgi:proteasome lid subunit RPN8/RPN11